MKNLFVFLWRFLKALLSTVFGFFGLVLFLVGLMEGTEGLAKLFVSSFLILCSIAPWIESIKKEKRKLSLLLLFFSSLLFSFSIWILSGYVEFPMDCTSISSRSRLGCTSFNFIYGFGGHWLVAATVLYMSIFLAKISYRIYIGKIEINSKNT